MMRSEKKVTYIYFHEWLENIMSEQKIEEKR